MTECECIKNCPFFNDQMKDNEGVAGIYKSGYCYGDNTNCARYMVFKALGREKIPTDLYPNMRARAEEITSSNH